MFPRTNSKSDVSAYAARLGFELGADATKVEYPGSRDALETVVFGDTNTVLPNRGLDNE